MGYILTLRRCYLMLLLIDLVVDMRHPMDISLSSTYFCPTPTDPYIAMTSLCNLFSKLFPHNNQVPSTHLDEEPIPTGIVQVFTLSSDSW